MLAKDGVKIPDWAQKLAKKNEQSKTPINFERIAQLVNQLQLRLNRTKAEVPAEEVGTVETPVTEAAPVDAEVVVPEVVPEEVTAPTEASDEPAEDIIEEATDEPKPKV